jgi:hypothetical protein
MAGFKTFVDLDILTAAEVNDFLMTQAVMVFDDATARSTQLGVAVAEGMVSYLKDLGELQYYDGSDWQPVIPPTPPAPVGASIGLVIALGGD